MGDDPDGDLDGYDGVPFPDDFKPYWDTSDRSPYTLASVFAFRDARGHYLRSANLTTVDIGTRYQKPTT
jgi:hypothetical protein